MISRASIIIYLIEDHPKFSPAILFEGMSNFVVNTYVIIHEGTRFLFCVHSSVAKACQTYILTHKRHETHEGELEGEIGDGIWRYIRQNTANAGEIATSRRRRRNPPAIASKYLQRGAARGNLYARRPAH